MSAPEAGSTTGPRALVLVAGTGRSGTSTLAGLLKGLGLSVPGPEVVPDPTNPKGFGEPQWVVDFHDDLLSRCRVQVSDARPLAVTRTARLSAGSEPRDRLVEWLGPRLEEAPSLVVKDPRLLWFLPLWERAARALGVEPVHVTMLRPPAEVVGSKRASYNGALDDAHGIAGWLNLMLHTERATRGGPRAFVRYHDLLDDWRPVLTTAIGRIDLPLAGLDGPAGAELDGFVDPGLHRVRLTWDDLTLPARLESLARETWALLDGLPEAPADPAASARLDALGEEYADYYAESEAVARSSLIAARAEPRGRPAHAAPAPEAVAPRTAVRALVSALIRRLPVRLRSAMPFALRSRARAFVSGGPGP